VGPASGRNVNGRNFSCGSRAETLGASIINRVCTTSVSGRTVAPQRNHPLCQTRPTRATRPMVSSSVDDCEVAAMTPDQYTAFEQSSPAQRANYSSPAAGFSRSGCAALQQKSSGEFPQCNIRAVAHIRYRDKGDQGAVPGRRRCLNEPICADDVRSCG
jgi:hypothetical protein